MWKILTVHKDGNYEQGWKKTSFQLNRLEAGHAYISHFWHTEHDDKIQGQRVPHPGIVVRYI